jgi:hypothetical protein
MGRTREERETSIIFNDESEIASVWTFSPIVQRVLARRKYKSSGRGVEGPYLIPKSSVSIRGLERRKGNPAALAAARAARINKTPKEE